MKMNANTSQVVLEDWKQDCLFSVYRPSYIITNQRNKYWRGSYKINFYISYTQCQYHGIMQEKKNKSESSIIRSWEALKQRFTESTKICNFHCRIVCRFIRNLYDVWSVNFLPQFGVPQLLEDVVGQDANECGKCYGDRGVPNCKLSSL